MRVWACLHVLLFAALVRAHVSHPLTRINYGAMASLAAGTASASISVSPTALPTSGQWVTVKFFNENATEQDWIGLYSPPTTNFSAHAPVDYQFANASGNYMNETGGQLRWYLINMRDAFQFVLFSGGVHSPVALALSEEVTFANYDEALQVHLSIDSTGSQVFVMWATKSVGAPQVKWNQLGSKTVIVTPAVTTTYSAEDMCGGEASGFGYRAPGMHHTAALQNLLPNTQYQYVVGDEAFGWSQIFNFTSPPVRGATTRVFMAAFGDMGTEPRDGTLRDDWTGFEPPALNTTNCVIDLLKKGISHVLHIGDISYARGFSADWDQFFSQIQPVASAVPYMVGIGNHESDYPSMGSNLYGNATDSGGECGVPFEHRFAMPMRFSNSPYYSYEYGNIHFVVISTEHDYSQGSDQYTWVESDLASVNRLITPWVIFAGHRPMYIDSTNYSPVTGDITVGDELMADFEQLLYKYEVDLCLWGHHHSYQRSCASMNFTCQEGIITSNNGGVDVYAPASAVDNSPRSPVHAVIGMAGYGLSQNFQPTAPSWLRFGDDQNYGYTTISTTGTTLQLSYFENVNNTMLDTFILQSRVPLSAVTM